ncbi:MAG: SHD1 domain-containing protein [Luteolibacter sp.]
MKTLSLFLTLTFVFSALCYAETRDFTDTSGKQITAELVAVRGDEVTIHMNGKEFTLPIGKFSEEDATYIREWAEANPAPAASAFKSSDLTVSIQKEVDRIRQEKKEDYKDSTGKSSGKLKDSFDQTQNSEKYMVKVSNTVSKEIPDLKITYTLYKLVRTKTTGEERSSSEDLEEIEGEATAPILEKLAAFEFTTDEVVLTKSEKFEAKTGNKTTLDEEIWGIIVKTYSGDTEIRVDCTPNGLIEKVASYKEKGKE